MKVTNYRSSPQVLSQTGRSWSPAVSAGAARFSLPTSHPLQFLFLRTSTHLRVRGLKNLRSFQKNVFQLTEASSPHFKLQVQLKQVVTMPLCRSQVSLIPSPSTLPNMASLMALSACSPNVACSLRLRPPFALPSAYRAPYTQFLVFEVQRNFTG